MFKHILVPTDGSALSEAAIRQAVEFAAETGARLTAFYAKQPYPDGRFGKSGFIAPITPEKLQRYEDKLAERFLGYAQECCKRAGVAFTGLSTASDMPAEAIISAAEQCGADLICMASHGYKGFRRLLIGSEASAVLTHTHIPVLILRPQDAGAS
jgi:nucleotide-binding universal stress UspA family protein